MQDEQRQLSGGRFDFDDGGTYCGGWEDGKAHGHGVCTGPKGQGAYAGSWHFGFEVSGVYTWPSGSSFEGQWQNGKRHGLGVETRGRWLYRGEWTQGAKGRYGVRQSATSNAKYEGTWASGLQDGYGSETYADGGTYQGQWMRGMRHGYGVRTSAPFGLASRYRGGGGGGSGGGAGGRDPRGSQVSLEDPTERRATRLDDARGGFVLRAASDEPSQRRGSLADKTKKGLLSKLRKQRSAGELDKRGTSSVRSGGSGGSASSWVSSVESTHSALTHASLHTDSNASFIVEDEHLDAHVTESYMGEWKNDKRTGFGVSERSDGLRYEGEWFNNRKYGYGVTTFRDGSREEGKYKNNVLVSSNKRKHMFLMRSAKFRERVDSAVSAAQRASKIAAQKADIAVSRTATARGKAEQADEAADQAKEDCERAQLTARQFAPDFKHPGFERIQLRGRYRAQPEPALPVLSVPPVPSPTDRPDGKTIPNHIPPAQVPNAVPLRRPSTQFPPGVGAGAGGAPSYNDSRGAPLYGEQAEQNKPFNPNEYGRGLQTRGVPLTQQPAGPQHVLDGRKLSLTQRSNLNQQQEWAPSSQLPQRRQSVLAQPRTDGHEPVFPDIALASYGRDELRTGTVHSEASLQGAMDHSRQVTDNLGYRQPPMDSRQMTDSQGYRQTMDSSRQTTDNQGYRQTQVDSSRQMTDSQNYRLGPMDQTRQMMDQSYRPGVDDQMNRQQGHRQEIDDQISRPHGYRQGVDDQTSRQQGYRQGIDNQTSRQQGYRQGVDDQIGRQQGYRQGVDDQTSRQQSYPPVSDNQTSRQQGYLPLSDNQMGRQHGYPPASDNQTSRQQGYPSGDDQMTRQQQSQQLYRQAAVEQTEDAGRPNTRTSIDYFDHYKRPPSRDASVDRLARSRSRQASVEPATGSRGGSVAPPGGAPPGGVAPTPPARAATPAGNGHLSSGRGSITRAPSRETPFEESLLRKRTLGQQIAPSPYQPKRTESLFVNPSPVPPPPAPGRGAGNKMISTPQTLQRKKSLPDVQGMPRGPDGAGMSREEVSMLGSARREEVRRMCEESEKLRANPLLYLVSPQVKDWFSRQQLVLVVLFVNISLGLMFYKLLT